MSTMGSEIEVVALPAPTSIFPLVRHLSFRTTPLLARTSATPNQVTLASLLTGLAAAWCFLDLSAERTILGAIFLTISYVLDNCDGEIARWKNMQSEFGRRFDDAGDWFVHAAVFAALGVAAQRASGDDFWLWCGVAAAVGATVNYAMCVANEYGEATHGQTEPVGSPRPETPSEWIVFVFRELFRADFCFILLVLAVLGMVWLILPVAAIGAQVYWIMALLKKSRRFHV